MMNSVHPSVSILHLLTSRLHVPVSRRAMSAAVEAHSQPFSLACLRQALAQWRVDSLAVQLPAQDLAGVPLPAIAHLHSGNFVLLTRAEAGRVVYQDVKGNTIKASLTDFDQAWSGKLLLAEAQAQAGEPTYRQSRYQEQLALARNITCWVLLVALFLWPVWLAVNSAAWAILVWWVSKVAGLATSILLLLSQLAPNQGWPRDCAIYAPAFHAKMY
jgi:ABC-type bacteriocin/lantibiotic exporter with double-glycine peptidase domain